MITRQKIYQAIIATGFMAIVAFGFFKLNLAGYESRLKTVQQSAVDQVISDGWRQQMETLWIELAAMNKDKDIAIPELQHLDANIELMIICRDKTELEAVKLMLDKLRAIKDGKKQLNASESNTNRATT